MVVFEQHIHADTKEDLVVKLPDELLNKSFTVKVEEEPREIADEKEQTVKEQIAADPFWQWVDSLNIDTRGWKFDRDEANER